MSDDIVARLVRWHTAMADEPKRAESKRTKHRETADLIERQQRALTAERERADRNQEDALTLMRALIKVRQQMFPQHDQRAVVSRDFPKLAAIDAARRK